jgi:hypothetical protein
VAAAVATDATKRVAARLAIGECGWRSSSFSAAGIIRPGRPGPVEDLKGKRVSTGVAGGARCCSICIPKFEITKGFRANTGCAGLARRQEVSRGPKVPINVAKLDAPTRFYFVFIVALGLVFILAGLIGARP